MGSYSQTAINIIKYILKEANEDEIQAISDAVEKRKSASEPRKMADLDFKKMAARSMEGFEGRFGLGEDIHKISRKLVGEMILEKVPGISADELDKLLDEWVPTQDKIKENNKSPLPKDLLTTMVEQFLAYSLGRMPEAESKSLAEQMPNWTEKYWGHFTPGMRALISDLLHGKMDTKEFWKKLEVLLVE